MPVLALVALLGLELAVLMQLELADHDLGHRRRAQRLDLGVDGAGVGRGGVGVGLGLGEVGALGLESSGGEL